MIEVLFVVRCQWTCVHDIQGTVNDITGGKSVKSLARRGRRSSTSPRGRGASTSPRGGRGTSATRRPARGRPRGGGRGRAVQQNSIDEV